MTTAQRVLSRYLEAARKAPASKVIALFEPFLKEHDEYIRKWVTNGAHGERSRALKLYPRPTSSKYGFGRTFQERVQWDAWLDKYGEAKLKEGIEEKRAQQAKYNPDREKSTDQEIVDLLYEYNSWRPGPKDFYPSKKAALPPAINGPVLAFGWEGIHNDTIFQKAVDKEIEWSIYNNRLKITHAIDKTLGALPVVSADEVRSQHSSQGIEGEFKITLDDGSYGTFATKSIGAGGWNIQRFHFRYLMKVSPTLKERNLKEKDQQDLPPEVVAVLQVLAPHKGEIVKDQPIPHNAAVAVYRMPGSSRNWGPLIREGLTTKQEVGRYMVKRWNYFMTDKGMKALAAL